MGNEPKKTEKETPDERAVRLKGLLKTAPNEFWSAATHTDAKKHVKADMKWEEYRKLKGDGLRAYWYSKSAPNNSPENEAEAKEALLRQFAKFKAKGLVKGDLKI